METINLCSRDVQRIIVSKPETRYSTHVEFGAYQPLRRPPVIEVFAKGSIAKLLRQAFWDGKEVRLLLPDHLIWKAFVIVAVPNFKLQCTGAPELTARGLNPLPNNNPLAKENIVKIRNKYYVAATSVSTPSEQNQDNIQELVRLSIAPSDRSGKWTRKNLADAVEHAKQLLEADASKDHIAIVKIVKVVRRPKTQFVVEDVL